MKIPSTTARSRTATKGEETCTSSVGVGVVESTTRENGFSLRRYPRCEWSGRRVFIHLDDIHVI